MNTQELFEKALSSKKINEHLHKTFGKKINLEAFDLDQLQDARNRIRTQLSQIRSNSGFNETIENEAYTEAQWMLDAINAEILQRSEFIVDDVENNDEDVEDQVDEYFFDTTTKCRKCGTEYGRDDKKCPNCKLRNPNHQQNVDRNRNMRNKSEGKTMRNKNRVTEGEVQQASAIVTAKTMVDRVGRWIEELSGMENDTLLQLGDSIRDEMGQEQSKQFISAASPAIQEALTVLKTTREQIATAVRTLTGEEQPMNMLGGEEPGMDPMDDPMEPGVDDLDGMDDLGAPEDEFAAADPAVGGAESAGRMRRESINRQSRVMKILAG